MHAIGKKIVEEAAEVWMAAEYECDGAAAEEISQLLYHLQVLMLAKGLTLEDVYRISERRALPHPPSTTESRTSMLRIAVPNKGSLSDPAAEMLREAGYRRRRDPRTARLDPTTTSSSSSCARATSPSTSARAPSTSASPAATCSSTPEAARREMMRSGSAASTFRFAGPPGRRSRVDGGRGRARGDAYQGLVERLTWPSTAWRPTSCRLDGAVESAVPLGVADVIADVVETGTTLRAPGLEVFGEPILRSEAC